MLLIDCHEPKHIIEKLKLSVPVSILTLKYGDYSFSDAIIERKTLSDFFISIKNIDYLYSQLADIILDFGVNVIFSRDMDQTIAILTRLYRQRNFKRPLNVIKKHRLYHAAKFFGISEKKLGILFDRFESIKNIANADKKNFKGIKSIGRKTVEKIKNILSTDISK